MRSHQVSFPIPFLSATDPLVSGEGAIDPLGFAPVGDRLADWILPGMAARMNRPRFLTAIAVCASVCEGLEEEIATDGTSPAHIVFEWLLVEGFARSADRDEVRQTPGIDKASEVRDAGIPMCARTYLKAASVFGFHGVYKRLARHLNIVDDDFHLHENGWILLKLWEREQGLVGFSDHDRVKTRSGTLRAALRSAVKDALEAGHVTRPRGWRLGWEFFANHLVPARMGRQEAKELWRLLQSESGDTRGEMFALIARRTMRESIAVSASDGIGDAAPVAQLRTLASSELGRRLKTIAAYESFCSGVEDAFEWLLYLSTAQGASSLPRCVFARRPEIQTIARALRPRLLAAEQETQEAPGQIAEKFSESATFFSAVRTEDDLYEAVLHRHAHVQKAKPPEGKRDWFERAADGGIFVRTPYRGVDPPSPDERWRRPYRLRAVRSFCVELRKGFA